MSDDAGWAISRNADMVERLREENARLRMEILTVRKASENHLKQSEAAGDSLGQLEHEWQIRYDKLWDEAEKIRRERDEAKAKLARVVETLEYLRKANDPHDCPRDWCECCVIESALAAAKGE